MKLVEFDNLSLNLEIMSQFDTFLGIWLISLEYVDLKLTVNTVMTFW